MNDTYITALIESLEKKIGILKEISLKNEEQLSIAKSDSFAYDKFDRNTEEKGILIYKLEKLDDGFELIYEKVKDELNANRDAHKDEIRRMQELITKITELSTRIQAEEARNKKAMETAFKTEKDRLKGQRSGMKAVRSYTQSMQMQGGASNYSGILDSKK
jgi:flagellar biosynthesis/type III secretory pathway chaperone